MGCVIKARERQTDLSSLDLNPLMRRVLEARGVSSDEIQLSLSQLPKPEAFEGLIEAARMLVEAVKEGQSIVVVGDYDVDGATSAALVISALNHFGFDNIACVVPNRFEDGYGLTNRVVDEAIAQYKAQWLLTVDNGISAHEGVAYAREKGLGVIITDHHIPKDTLPNANAIVHPCLGGEAFANLYLAGVGVAFYLMLAVRAVLREESWFEQIDIPDPNMAEYLDLVALGTLADVVPLDYVNRILVAQGLLRLRNYRGCMGIKALLAVAQKDQVGHLSSKDLVFGIAPLLNAAGRLLDNPSIGVECLLTQDPVKADTLAAQLSELNQERRKIEAGMQKTALQILQTLDLEGQLPTGLCLYDPQWHQGIVGILASRIKDRTHLPTIIFTKVNDQELKGSARSLVGLNMVEALDAINDQLPGVLIKYGGHAGAAGLTIAADKFDEFKKAFDEQVTRMVSKEDLNMVYETDGELDASELTIEMASLIQEGGPWGQKFSEPSFHGVFNVIEQRIVGQRHLKLVLQLEGAYTVMNAICFNVDLDKWPAEDCNKVQIVYRLDVNEYRGSQQLQLIVQYIDKVEEEVFEGALAFETFE